MRSQHPAVSILMFGFLLCGGAPGGAQEPQEVLLDSLRRDTPSGKYSDPASFFRFHGYATLSFADPQPEAGTDPSVTPQILIGQPSPRSGRNEGGFRNDAALFVGGEPFDRVGSVLEIHFVGNALDPVLTEAKFTYDLLVADEHELSIAGGRFWWPFGIHATEWFSPLNDFVVLSPAATEVVPAHYNEVGIMAEGASRVGDGWGLNYVGAIGNGVPGFGLMPNVGETASDHDGDRTVTGRLGIVRRAGASLEVGLSAATGRMREGVDGSRPMSDPMRFGASFSAVGVDVSGGWRGLRTRAYYYRSQEQLEGAGVPMLDRVGYTAEVTGRFELSGSERLHAMRFQARVGAAEEDDLSGDRYRHVQVAGAFVLEVTDAFEVRVAYVDNAERLDAVRLANDVFTTSLSVQF